MWVSILLMVAALGGLVLALYFTLLYYRILAPASCPSPGGSRGGSSACELVVFSSYGRLFVLPNSVYALPFYCLVLVAAYLRLFDVASLAGAPARLFWDVLAVSCALSVVMGLYLVHALFFKLRTVCVLCLLGHAINLLIAILVLVALVSPSL